jgi:hypothetical protein
MWQIGDHELIIRRWYKNGNDVTSGSADVAFVRNNSGTVEYLQQDESSWDTATYRHSMTFTPGLGWRLGIEIPSSMQSHNIVAVAEHSDPALPPLGEGHYVTSHDLDDLSGGASLTQDQIAEAVWDALLDDYEQDDTFGGELQWIESGASVEAG